MIDCTDITELEAERARHQIEYANHMQFYRETTRLLCPYTQTLQQYCDIADFSIILSLQEVPWRYGATYWAKARIDTFIESWQVHGSGASHKAACEDCARNMLHQIVAADREDPIAKVLHALDRTIEIAQDPAPDISITGVEMASLLQEFADWKSLGAKCKAKFH